MKINLFKILKYRSTGRDLVFILVPIIIIVSSVLGGVNYYVSYQKEVLLLKEKGIELAENLSKIAAKNIYVSNKSELGNLAGIITKNSKIMSVVSISIHDQIHNVIYSSYDHSQGPVFTIKKPINFLGKRLGTTEVVITMKNVNKRQKFFLYFTVTLTVITVLIVSIALIWISDQLARKPVSILVESISSLTAGRYVRRLPLVKYHYLNMISKSVNGLMEEISIREQRLLTYQKKLRSLTQELLNVEERERRHIASEIHDRVGHALASIAIKLGFVRDNVNKHKNRNILEEVAQLIKQTNRDVQSLIFEISPPILYDIGIIAAIEWLIRKISKEHELIIELEYGHELKQISQNLKIFIFRAVRELLFNVVKHAKASKVELSISMQQRDLLICVSDNGIGFPETKSQKEKFGIFSIRERLSHFDGQLIIHSEPNLGALVVMKLIDV